MAPFVIVDIKAYGIFKVNGETWTSEVASAKCKFIERTNKLIFIRPFFQKSRTSGNTAFPHFPHSSVQVMKAFALKVWQFKNGIRNAENNGPATRRKLRNHESALCELCSVYGRSCC